MRALLLLFGIFLLGITQVFGQVKIGDNPQTINPAAVLELESTTMALIITRVTTEQMLAITPSQGALVYNTDTACVHYYNGTEWNNLCAASTANINVTTDPIVNQLSTIVLTTTANGNNLEVAPESIRSEQILDGGIFGDDINDNSIGPNKLANNSVGKLKLSENAVGPFAIDRDSLPLSFFINDVPFLTSGDLTTVSENDGNSISNGTDGGAFYNQQPLVEAIATNTATIANDLDTNPENELQNLSLSGNSLTLSDPVNGDDVINLESFAGGGDPTDELQDLAFDIDTNILTITTPATAGNQVDLSSLAAVNTGSTEVVDGTTLTGIGNTGDPFKIEPSVTAGQFLRTDALGNVIWDDLPTGTGGAVSSDEITITGDGAATALSVLDGGITPIKLEPSATNGQFLRTDATGAVIWDDLPTGTGGAVSSDGVSITGDGVSTDLSVIDAGITPIKIEPSANPGEVLTTDASGVVVWAAGGGNGSVLADQLTITGDGQLGTVFQVADAGINTLQLADDAVTTLNILDDNVTPAKIEAGTDGQVLTTDDAGDVIWAAGAAELADQITITGDGQPTTEFMVADNGINTQQLADDAVISIKILDDNVTPEKIAAGTNGQVLTTDAGGDVVWANTSPDNQNLVSAELINANDDLEISIQNGNPVTADLSALATDAEVVAAITATEIADGDRNDTNEIQNITSTDGSVTITSAGDDFNLSVGEGSHSGTAGSIFFSDGLGALSEDNAELFWDTTNDRLGIGVNNPSHSIHTNGAVRVQLGFIGNDGTVGSPTFRFRDDTNTGMFSNAADEIGFAVGGILGLTIDEPTTGITNVIVNGGFSTNIRVESGAGAITIAADDFTVIIENATSINLPVPDNAGAGANLGQIYILKNLTGGSVTIDSYINELGNPLTTLPIGITKLQSDGTNWHQIN